MWFKLAGADFSKNNLGTMSSISSSYLINYSKLTGMSGTPTSVSYAGSSAGTAKSVEVTITVTSGYSFKNGSKITASGGATGAVFTADKDYVGGNTFKFSMNITGNVELTGAAEAVSTGGGSSSGGGGEVIVPTPDGTTDITNLFTFSLTGTAYPTNGVAKSSVYFDSCSPVDISSYSGTHLYISHAQFTPTAGGSSGYGAVFFDASGNMLKFEAFPSYTSSGPKGAYRDSFLEIPSGAKTFATSIFNSAAISNSVYEGTTSDFHCSIVNLSTETDITSMFDFNTSGYAWRVSDGDGEVTSYKTQYWDSDTVDMSAYAGKAIKIAAPVARTTQNTQVPYGYAYEDASGNNYVLHHFALLDDGGTLLAGNVTDLTIMLPSDIKNLLVCYFSDAMYNAANPITEEVRNGFYCKLLG